MNSIRCEACRTAPVEQMVTEYVAEPFHLCAGCADRLQALCLRPREWFNLAAKHGIDEFLLHDDFYEEDGAAMQPREEVEGSDRFPAPTLDEARDELERLIDYAFTRWKLTPAEVEAFAVYSPAEVMGALQERFAATVSLHIRARTFEICAKALGPHAASFLRDRIAQGEPYSSSLALALAKCLPAQEGFAIALERLREVTPQQLPLMACSLAAFNTQATLDWIEQQVKAPDVVLAEGWGRLAAMSHLEWSRVERWLDEGRPLSLVALDALNACWNYNTPQLRERRPKLKNAPAAQALQTRLEQYAAQDDAPRVQRAVRSILPHLGDLG